MRISDWSSDVCSSDLNGPSTSSGRTDVGGCLLKAAVLFEAGQPLRIEEVAIVKPGPHELLIRTAAVVVSRSDLHFVDGAYPPPMPTIPVHEAAGVVEVVRDEVSTVHTCVHGDCFLPSYFRHSAFLL